MFEALLIGAVAVAALACPVMMLLGRRGIGPGCAMMGCEPKKADELGELRKRQRELASRIAELEAPERPASTGRRPARDHPTRPAGPTTSPAEARGGILEA